MTTSLKTCFKCGAEKPLTDFYRHSAMADGRLNKCKECTKSDSRKNRADRIDYYRAYDRERGMLPERRRAVHLYHRTDAGKAAGRRSHAAWAARNRDQRKAQWALSNAVRDGKVLPWPICANPGCHETENIQGHHTHYEAPQCVVWLCVGCHSRLHKEHRQREREELTT